MRWLVAALALVAAATAQAAGEPTAYGHAQVGSLSVVSGVVVGRMDVDMRGVWNDEHVPCSTKRRLTVRALIDHQPSGKRVARSGRFVVPNCSEGGPNVGFTLSARRIGLACPNGAWKPGRYDFVTTTIEPTRKLLATASLLWRKRSC